MGVNMLQRCPTRGTGSCGVYPPTFPHHGLRGSPRERNSLVGPVHSSLVQRPSPGCLLLVIVHLSQDRECQGLVNGTQTVTPL